MADTQTQTTTPTASLDAIVDGLLGDSADSAPEPVGAAPEPDAEPVAAEAQPAEAPAPEAAPAKAEEVKTEATADDLLDGKGDPRFEAIARKEKKQREAHAQRMAELKRQADELEAHRAQVAEFTAAKARIQRDPVAALKALGVSEAQFRDIAQEVYGHVLGDQAPAEWRAKREAKGALGEVEQLRAEINAMKEQTLRAQQEAQAAQLRAEYEGRIKAALGGVSDEARYVRRLATKDQARAISALMSLANQRAQEDGEVPDPASLVGRLEEALREEARLFIDDEAPAAPKQTTQKAGKQTTATLTNRNTSNATKPRSSPAKPSKAELIDEILSDLKEGRTSV